MMQRVMFVYPQPVVVENWSEQDDRHKAIEPPTFDDVLVRGIVREREHPAEHHSGKDAARDLRPQRGEEQNTRYRRGV